MPTVDLIEKFYTHIKITKLKNLEKLNPVDEAAIIRLDQIMAFLLEKTSLLKSIIEASQPHDVIAKFRDAENEEWNHLFPKGVLLSARTDAQRLHPRTMSNQINLLKNQFDFVMTAAIKLSQCESDIRFTANLIEQAEASFQIDETTNTHEIEENFSNDISKLKHKMRHSIEKNNSLINSYNATYISNKLAEHTKLIDEAIALQKDIHATKKRLTSHKNELSRRANILLSHRQPSLNRIKELQKDILLYNQTVDQMLKEKAKPASWKDSVAKAKVTIIVAYRQTIDKLISAQKYFASQKKLKILDLYEDTAKQKAQKSAQDIVDNYSKEKLKINEKIKNSLQTTVKSVDRHCNNIEMMIAELNGIKADFQAQESNLVGPLQKNINNLMQQTTRIKTDWKEKYPLKEANMRGQQETCSHTINKMIEKIRGQMAKLFSDPKPSLNALRIEIINKNDYYTDQITSLKNSLIKAEKTMPDQLLSFDGFDVSLKYKNLSLDERQEALETQLKLLEQSKEKRTSSSHRSFILEQIVKKLEETRPQQIHGGGVNINGKLYTRSGAAILRLIDAYKVNGELVAISEKQFERIALNIEAELSGKLVKTSGFWFFHWGARDDATVKQYKEILNLLTYVPIPVRSLYR